MRLFPILLFCSFPAFSAEAQSLEAKLMGEGQVMQLPKPSLRGKLSLEEALDKRHSVREFSATPLTIEQISKLLWAGQGITRDWGGRTAPSAGALYPIEIYLLLQEALYHYLPKTHSIELVTQQDLRAKLAEAALRQESITAAPAVFIICADLSRTAIKYGERSRRYVDIEVGHVGQNILLQAVSLGLGAVPIGAFSDAKVKQVLNLSQALEALYIIPVGHPEE